MKKLLIFLSIAGYTAAAFAAELQLHDEARPQGPLVLLGDVVQIHARHSVEAAELAVIDLLALPAPGEKRVLRLREIQDLLAVRGVNLADHRFSGASRVTIYGPRRDAETVARPAATHAKPAAVGPVMRQPIATASSSAIEKYLASQTGDEGWNIELKLSDEQVAQIASLGSLLVVTGGAAPWTGPQQFVLSGEASSAPPVTVAAQVSVPPSMVVARHSLPKGVILRETDVRLQRGVPTRGEAEVYQRLEDVVGKETTRTIAEGQILDDRTVRRQVLVARGEIVTLYSRAAGIRVRTTARARDDGAQGDLVTVETLQDRKPLFARVSGPQEVEVFAQAASAENSR